MCRHVSRPAGPWGPWGSAGSPEPWPLHGQHSNTCSSGPGPQQLPGLQTRLGIQSPCQQGHRAASSRDVGAGCLESPHSYPRPALLWWGQGPRDRDAPGGWELGPFMPVPLPSAGINPVQTSIQCQWPGMALDSRAHCPLEMARATHVQPAVWGGAQGETRPHSQEPRGHAHYAHSRVSVR